MGTMVEFRANSAIDTPDYLVGEEIFIAKVGAETLSHEGTHDLSHEVSR